MNLLFAVIGAISLLPGVALAQAQPQISCEVPDSFLSSEYALDRVSAAVRNKHKLNVIVVGSASSALAAPQGTAISYPARLQETLRRRLPGVDIKVTSRAKPRQTARDMAKAFEQILRDDAPALVIWQTGTVDAIRGVPREEFRTTLELGIQKLHSGGADVVLMNSQFSPRTETMIAIEPYISNMLWASQERGAPLFDRFAIMSHWSDDGTFDFYGRRRDLTLAQQVHACIGNALAGLIIKAADLEPLEAEVGKK